MKELFITKYNFKEEYEKLRFEKIGGAGGTVKRDSLARSQDFSISGRYLRGSKYYPTHNYLAMILLSKENMEILGVSSTRILKMEK